MFQSVLPLFGQVGLLASAAGVAGTAAAWLAKQSIEARFKATADRNLVKQKYESDRTIEGIKAEIGRFQDRASKLHQREYDVLPQAWELLNKAYGLAREASGSGAVYLGRNGGDRAVIEATINQSDLDEWQKERLKSSSNWYGDYTAMRLDKSIIDARAAIVAFKNYVVLNCVLIQAPLENLMLEAAHHIGDANEMRWAVVEEINEPTDHENMKEHLRKAGDLLAQIKDAMRGRLFDTGMLPR